MTSSVPSSAGNLVGGHFQGELNLVMMFEKRGGQPHGEGEQAIADDLRAKCAA